MITNPLENNRRIVISAALQCDEGKRALAMDAAQKLKNYAICVAQDCRLRQQIAHWFDKQWDNVDHLPKYDTMPCFSKILEYISQPDFTVDDFLSPKFAQNMWSCMADVPATVDTVGLLRRVVSTWQSNGSMGPLVDEIEIALQNGGLA
jgi:hypothetical protein